MLSKEEGGRHTPFFNNYRPQFYFRTTDVTGEVTLPEGTEMAMPGDNTEMTVKLIQPIAMAEGLRFAIREGGRTVGAGRVIKILKYAIRRPPVRATTSMATTDIRPTITLACTVCKHRNYTTRKNKRNDPDRVELKKYCRWCGRHTAHRETR